MIPKENHNKTITTQVLSAYCIKKKKDHSIVVEKEFNRHKASHTEEMELVLKSSCPKLMVYVGVLKSQFGEGVGVTRFAADWLGQR